MIYFVDREEQYKQQIQREKKARQKAEKLLESKVRELFHVNENLKESQKALQEKNEQRTYDLIRVQRLAKIASWRWHVEKQYIIWSDEIDHMLQLSRKDRKRERFWRTIYYLKHCKSVDRHRVLNFMRNIVRSNRSDHTPKDMILEHELHFPDNSMKIIRFLCECTYNKDGSVKILLGTVQDITRQKNYERELLRKEKEAQERVIELEELHDQLVKAQIQAELENRTKSEFLSTVNHELRTPLTSIHGALELIKQLDGPHKNNRKTDSLLDIAYRNSERLKFLVNDILDTEKIDSQNIEFYYSDHNLKEIIETSIVLNYPYAKKI